MSVQNTHPLYSKFKLDWQDIQNALDGERAIKHEGESYLPRTNGMIEATRNNIDCVHIYDGYRKRAQYPEWVRDSIRSMIGLVSRLKSTVELQHKQLEILKTQATDDGFSLDELFIRTVSKGVEFGRYGLLSDFDSSGKAYIAVYDACNIINWKINPVGGRRDASLIVLKESKLVGEDEFSHQSETQYRVLDLDELGFYRVRLFNQGGELTTTIEPKMGSKRIDFIPFVFGGSINNSVEPNPIPLLTMARSAIKYYQLSADYFQSLYMTAHPQPYAVGVESQPVLDDDGDITSYESPLKMTGAIALWELPKESSVGYLEVSGSGIELTKKEMSSQRDAAIEAGAKVIDAGSNESGEARKARQDDQHATLHTIVASASNAIEQAVKYIALWLGVDDSKIEYSVALEFNVAIDSQILNNLYNLALSNKISFDSVWNYMQTGRLPERSYEDEILALENEQNSLPLVARSNIEP